MSAVAFARMDGNAVADRRGDIVFHGNAHSGEGVAEVLAQWRFHNLAVFVAHVFHKLPDIMEHCTGDQGVIVELVVVQAVEFVHGLLRNSDDTPEMSQKRRRAVGDEECER